MLIEAWRARGQASPAVLREILAPMRDLLTVPVVGTGKIVDVKFVGSSERLRLEMSSTDTLASAQRPGAPMFTIEAWRAASDVDLLRRRRHHRTCPYTPGARPSRCL